MVKYGLYVELEAQPGKESEAEKFLTGAHSLVAEEKETVAWFAIKMSPSKFGIFDVFADEAGREAHLNGKVAAALMQKAPDLFVNKPDIMKPEIIASVMPQDKLRAAA